MRVVILTGMSGAGKSHALNCLEDMGYFCVDNLPPDLIRTFIQLYAQRMRGAGDEEGRIAINVDIRGGAFFDSVFEALRNLDEANIRYEVLYLDADDATLIKRYKESRRMHPVEGASLKESIDHERRMLNQLRERADQVINTSNLKASALKKRLQELYNPSDAQRPFPVSVVSFGFKYGIPNDADLVLDARFINNPYYVESLKAHSGLEAPVRDYVMSFPETRVFLDKLFDLLDFLIPQYIREGKPQLVIGIGCTGGMHRSVAIAQRLADGLRDRGYAIHVEHRDLKQEASR